MLNRRTLLAAGPVLAGPVLAGPLLAGPLLASPLLASPLLAGPLLASPLWVGSAMAGPEAAGADDRSEPPAALAQRFAALEAESGGRLGVRVRDMRTGATFGHRADERFPLCSTFKLLAAGAVLARVDAGRESLERRIPYGPADLVDYSPVTQPRLGAGGMALGDLCEAAVTLSDNTAANLILSTLGGPAGLTAYLRTLGDPVTRLDRTEPTLNEAVPGDPRDTTTPTAMLADLERLTLGTALIDATRAILVGLAPGQPDRRCPSAGPIARRLAGGRQDGFGPAGDHQRRRPALAPGRRAAPRRGLSHRDGGARGAARGDDRGGRPRGRGSPPALSLAGGKPRGRQTSRAVPASGRAGLPVSGGGRVPITVEVPAEPLPAQGLSGREMVEELLPLAARLPVDLRLVGPGGRRIDGNGHDRQDTDREDGTKHTAARRRRRS